MDLTELFTFKAEQYARYRWGYAREALETIIKHTRLGEHSIVADIGAGPGKLWKHFLGNVERVYMVEPNAAMRAAAEKRYGTHPSCRVMNGRAEASGLPSGEIDLITVGQAIGYFEAHTVRREFARILKPGGWLAVLRNYGTDPERSAAIEEVYREENGCNPAVIPSRPPWTAVEFYFGEGNVQKLTFPFVHIQTRAQFIGGLASASYAPLESHPLYPRFAAAASQVFERFSQNGILHTLAETELYLGQPEIEGGAF